MVSKELVFLTCRTPFLFRLHCLTNLEKVSLIHGKIFDGCPVKVCHPHSVTIKWPVLGFCQTLAGKVSWCLCECWRSISCHGVVLDIFHSPLPSPPCSVPWGLTCKDEACFHAFWFHWVQPAGTPAGDLREGAEWSPSLWGYFWLV